ncbi:MAG: YegP family protein [Alphaproteobacteria bacterium]
MSSSDKWEIYQDKAGEYRWRRTASNGNIVGSATEGYAGKSDCVANAERHGMDGNPKGLGGKDKWEFYTDKKDEHRWRRTASNGEKVGGSSEGYSSKSDCEANAKRNGYSG